MVQRQSCSSTSRRQKAVGSTWRMVGPKRRSRSPSLGLTFAPEVEAGTMETRVPFKSATDDNWVFLSPSNRATSFQERKRKGEQERPPPQTKGPSFPRQLPSPPQFYHRPILSVPHQMPLHAVLGGLEAKGSPALFPALPKEGSPATLACDHHLHASLDHTRGYGGSAKKGESPVPPGEFLGWGWGFLPS